MTTAAPAARSVGFVIALMMLGYIALYGASMLSADSVRDLSAGWQLYAHGEWPAQGPDIFSRYALGPIWFWLLGLLMQLPGSLASIVFAVGALAALKFPLAYLLGRRVAGRHCGLLLVAFVGLHGVSLIEHWTLAHTNLVMTTSLLVLWLGARLHAAPSDRDWILFAAAAVLALHAHPSALLSLLAAAPALWTHGRRAISWPAAMAIAAIGALAVLPSLLFAASGTLWYAQGGSASALTTPLDWPQRAIALWLRLVVDPLRLQAEVLGGGAAVAAAGNLAALVGLAALLLWERTRLALALLAATVVGVLALVAVRVQTPVWMALAVLPFVALLLALGWTRLGERLPRRARAFASWLPLLLSLGMQAWWWQARSTEFRLGEQRLPEHRVADLAYASDDSLRQQPLLSVLALDRLARRWCTDYPGVAVYGDLALGVAVAEAVPFLLRDCAPSRWPRIGGAAASAVAGLVRSSGAVQAPGWPRVPGYVLVPLRQVVHPREGSALRERPPYPPVTLFGRAPQSLRFRMELAADEVLAWSTRYRFEPAAQLDLRGAELERSSASAQTRLFRCRAACSLELELTTPFPELFQLYTLPADAFTRTDRGG